MAGEAAHAADDKAAWFVGTVIGVANHHFSWGL